MVDGNQRLTGLDRGPAQGMRSLRSWKIVTMTNMNTRMVSVRGCARDPRSGEGEAGNEYFFFGRRYSTALPVPLLDADEDDEGSTFPFDDDEGQLSLRKGDKKGNLGQGPVPPLV